MYPDFQYLLHGLFGVDMPAWLSLFKTFGLLVSVSFIAAGYVTASELKRKEKQGLLKPEFKTIVIGKPLPQSELIITAISGFIFGFKIGGVFGHVQDVSPDPMGYLFSMNGNIYVGIAAGVLLFINKYRTGKKQELPQPQQKTIGVWPHDLIMEIVMVAAFGGIIGAKLFNAFETWDDFVRDPIHNLTSSSGLTFLGGLIMATTFFYFFARRHKIPFKHLADAAAPAIMLAYGLGRLGCQLSGDGDWGIYNTAYVADDYGITRVATEADKLQALHIIGNSEHANVLAPSWLPNWLFGMNFPHNVGNEGKAIAGCLGDYCHVLPVSVFPTPIYESIVCILLFFILWSLRKKMKRTLQMFATYMIMVGVERFLVELIRVNFKYDWGFIHPTQAEIISVLLMVSGTAILLFYKDKPAIEMPLETAV